MCAVWLVLKKMYKTVNIIEKRVVSDIFTWHMSEEDNYSNKISHSINK